MLEGFEDERPHFIVSYRNGPKLEDLKIKPHELHEFASILTNVARQQRAPQSTAVFVSRNYTTRNRESVQAQAYHVLWNSPNVVCFRMFRIPSTGIVWPTNSFQPSLKVLEVGGCSITDAAAEGIARGLANSEVWEFSLSCVELSPKALAWIMEALMTSDVNELTLSGCTLEELDVVEIATRLRGTRISVLELSGSYLEPKEVAILMWGVVDSMVQNLDLSTCDLDDVCLEYIAQALPYTRVTRLVLTGNQITLNGVKNLLQSLNRVIKVVVDDNIAKRLHEIDQFWRAQTLSEPQLNFLSAALRAVGGSGE